MYDHHSVLVTDFKRQSSRHFLSVRPIPTNAAIRACKLSKFYHKGARVSYLLCMGGATMSQQLETWL